MRSVKPDSEDSWERKVAKQINYDNIERDGMTEAERQKMREKPFVLRQLEAQKNRKTKPKEKTPMDVLLDTEEKSVAVKITKQIKQRKGRPKGSKDKKPRKRRTQAEVRGCAECEHLMPNGCELSKCHFRKVREG